MFMEPRDLPCEKKWKVNWSFWSQQVKYLATIVIDFSWGQNINFTYHDRIGFLVTGKKY